MAIAVFFANGYEEIEALTVVDLTRRAGIETWMVSITDEKVVTGSHGISVAMDKILSDVNFDEVDMIVLPGGMPGTLNLEACEPLMEKVKEFDKAPRNGLLPHVRSGHPQGELLAFCGQRDGDR